MSTSKGVAERKANLLREINDSAKPLHAKNRAFAQLTRTDRPSDWAGVMSQFNAA